MGKKILSNKSIEIDLVGTTAVMNYADEHPDERFCHTLFKDSYGTTIMVSDEEENSFSATLDCIEEGIYKWAELPNGWRRIRLSVEASWLCNKGDRYLFMDM